MSNQDVARRISDAKAWFDQVDEQAAETEHQRTARYDAVKGLGCSLRKDRCACEGRPDKPCG